MRGSDSVYVDLLHYIKILSISFPRNRPAVVGIEIMAVYAPDHKRHTVEIDFFALDFNLLETYFICFNGGDFIAVLNGDNKSIKIGMLGRPFFRIFHFRFH